MKLVIIESPYAAESGEGRKRFDEYLRACLRDCLYRGEAPFASHALYTLPGVLDDDLAAERELGIKAGLRWGKCADLTAVYVDHGISLGMYRGIAQAIEERRPVELRSLEGEDTRPIADSIVRGFAPDCGEPT